MALISQIDAGPPRGAVHNSPSNRTIHKCRNSGRDLFMHATKQTAEIQQLRSDQLLTADQPISSRQQDRLNRQPFASALATAISAWRGNESLVIALYGAWGVGKTSVKNLTLEHLRESHAKQPIILEFNPWMWAAQHALQAAFFTELAAALGKSTNGNNSSKAVKKLRLYAARLRLRGYIYTNVPRIIGITAAVVAALGVVTSFTSNPWAHGTLLALLIAAIVLGTATTYAAGITDRLAAIMTAEARAEEQTLEEQKQALALELKALPRPILVVIDDIDRLTPPEIKILFQVIKANADFPNLTYFLLFQRDYVEGAMEKELGADGREYLKKLVQAGFDIPRAETTQIHTILFDGLNEILNRSNATHHFDQERWSALFPEALAPFFATLRDVNRFLSELEFHIGVFRPHGVLEVNPIDLIGLETLRHFQPDVYHRLPNLKGRLTTEVHRIISEDNKEKHQAIIGDLVSSATSAYGAAVEELLKDLFPPASWNIDGRIVTTETYPEWEAALRVCHDRIFERYFHLALPNGQLSQATVEQVLSCLTDARALTAELLSLRELGLLDAMLCRLEPHKSDIRPENILPVLTALFNIGDDLSDGRQHAFNISALERAYRLARSTLNREIDHDRRVLSFTAAAKESGGLYLPVHLLRLDESEERRKEHPELCAFRPQDLPELLKDAVARIKSNASTLRQQRHLGRLLHMWGTWNGFGEPRAWVAEFIRADDGLTRFLLAFAFTTTQWESGKPPITQWQMRAENINPLIDIEELAKCLDRLNVDSISPEEQHAVQAFHEMRERKIKGIPDDPISPLMFMR